MPYKRRYRSRRRFKKRRKRRSGRSAFGFRVSKQVSKQVEGVRNWCVETRNEAVVTSQNQVKFNAVCVMADRNAIEGIIKSVYDAGNVNTGIGETSIGAYESTLENYKADIVNYKTVSHFRNLDEHPHMLTVYECVAKRTFASDTGNANGMLQLTDDVFHGWELHDTSAATSTATAKFGIDGMTHTDHTDEIETYSQFRQPESSKLFRANWRIVKKKKFKLNPGDDVYWTMRVKNRVWNPQRVYVDYVDGTDTLDFFKGYTKVLFVKLSGLIGRSSVANEPSVVGLMETDCSYDCLAKCKIQPLISAVSEKYNKTNIDDVSAKTLVGPTTHAHLDDQN